MTTKRRKKLVEVAAEAQQADTNLVKPVLTDKFRLSSRLDEMLAGGHSAGYSCNTFSIGDSVPAIGAAINWGLNVSYWQGAPSWDASQLRPSGSPISTGGDSCGVPGFMPIFDAELAAMRRQTKKNGAGIMWLDCFHPDLPEFISCPTTAMFKGVYVPTSSEGIARLLANPELVSLLVESYEKNRIFICKDPGFGKYGSKLYRNLCTENKSPHEGGCSLGCINLGQVEPEELESVFVESAISMYSAMQAMMKDLPEKGLYTPSADNVQFGLGVTGLASFLAINKVPYDLFTLALQIRLAGFKSIQEAADDTQFNAPESKADKLACAFIRAYNAATNALQGKVVRAFLVQPSATGSYELADKQGYTVSPELQPLHGFRTSAGVFVTRSSALLGDTTHEYHPNIETTTDVPYKVYADLCSVWQTLMNLTGLAHSHSACYYSPMNVSFSQQDLQEFLHSARECLYYRLYPVNAVALDKTKVGDGVEVCSLEQVMGSIDCDCTG